jgi:hypothetical protein
VPLIFKMSLRPVDSECQRNTEMRQGRWKEGLRMTKREIIRTLILSPCYLTLKLKERAKLIQRLIRQRRSP